MFKEDILHLFFCTCISKDVFKINNKGLKYDQFNINDSYYFAKTKRNNINKISQQSEVKTEKDEIILFRIRKSKNNTYTIENPINKNMLPTKQNIKNLENKLWYVLNCTPYRDINNLDEYIVNKNDIIKFGNSKYEVIEKKINNIDNNIIKIYLQNNYDVSRLNRKKGSIFKMTEIKDADNDENNICRICFDGSSSEENPKIRLCSCKNYIHYECLKMWLKTKIKKHSNRKKTVLSYFIHKFNCEVCTMPYPLKFKISGLDKEYSLIDIKLPENENYIVLESIGIYGKNNTNYKFIHVVKLIDEIISFGSGELCDIIDCNYNISSYHAEFKYNSRNGDLILENKSKQYHTLVLVKNNIEINKNKIDFQIGRILITANLLKKGINESNLY